MKIASKSGRYFVISLRILIDVRYSARRGTGEVASDDPERLLSRIAARAHARAKSSLRYGSRARARYSRSRVAARPCKATCPRRGGIASPRAMQLVAGSNIVVVDERRARACVYVHVPTSGGGDGTGGVAESTDATRARARKSIPKERTYGRTEWTGRGRCARNCARAP